MKYIDTLTEDGKDRLYAKLYWKLINNGGGMFGLDWITIRITNPHIASVMWELLYGVKYVTKH